MNDATVRLGDLMASSGIGFGTSGARGLVSDLSDRLCWATSLAFLQHLEQIGELGAGQPVGLGADLRPSSDRILAAAAQAVEHKGCRPVDLGRLPSPAVALWGIQRGRPTIMVTGSHIPADRNGLKYTRRTGEILKSDEVAIQAQQVAIPAGLFDPRGQLTGLQPALESTAEARRLYLDRYLDFFPAGCLAGQRVGVFMHSAVGRDLMVEIFESLGAEVARLGFSDTFVPVDTEAIRAQDQRAARAWAAEHRLDAIVSTDGDSDRPLLADERGDWLRGDVLGILCAAWLGAEAVVTPVSSNSALEKSGRFARVIRTRIGSPWVIEGMRQARADGHTRVVGYEANGGFLIETPIQRWGRSLSALPTRDALIVQLSVLLSAVEAGGTVGSLLDSLPRRFTHSDRLEHFPTGLAKARIGELHQGDPDRDRAAIEAVLGREFGRVQSIDATDGLRITFDSDEVVHLRPSGNAPELRCYTEADNPQRARQMNRSALAILESWRG